MRPSAAFRTTFLVMAVALLQACAAHDRSMVVAMTGTVIGVEVIQNPTTGLPQAKLGYNRSELAMVPTNKGFCYKEKDSDEWHCTATHGNGASDTTDVLMELRYGGIFDLGASSGIYQRLAIGKTAVVQPGAAFMFAKDADGTLTQPAAVAVATTLSVEEVLVAQREAVDEIADEMISNNATDEQKLKMLFKCSGHIDAEAARLATLYAGKSRDEFRKQFSGDFQIEAPLMIEAYKACKRAGN